MCYICPESEDNLFEHQSCITCGVDVCYNAGGDSDIAKPSSDFYHNLKCEECSNVTNQYS